MASNAGTLRITLPSDTSYLHLVTNLTRNASTAAGFDEADADKVALATDEAVTNVIQHAYHGAAGRSLEVEVRLTDDSIEIRIIHDGDPLDLETLSRDFNPVQLIRDKRKGGIGLVLMRRLMDRVDFLTTDDHRSACCLRKYKSAPPDPPTS